MHKNNDKKINIQGLMAFSGRYLGQRRQIFLVYVHVCIEPIKCRYACICFESCLWLFLFVIVLMCQKHTIHRKVPTYSKLIQKQK